MSSSGIHKQRWVRSRGAPHATETPSFRPIRRSIQLVVCVATLAGCLVPLPAGAAPAQDPSPAKVDSPPPFGDGELPTVDEAQPPSRRASVPAADRQRAFDTAQEAASDGNRQRYIVSLAVNFDFSNPGASKAATQAARSSVERVLKRSGGEEVLRYRSMPATVVLANSAELDALENMPEVRTIQVDGKSQTTLAESTVQIGAKDAHSVGYDGSGTRIAILDDGFDSRHSNLDNIIGEACVSGDYSCQGMTISTGSGSSNPRNACDGDHGTHVAGIAAGNSGVAPGADLVTIDVFDECDGAYDSSLIWGMEYVQYAYQPTYANDEGQVAALNMSIGNGTSWNRPCDSSYQATADAVDFLKWYGVATVVASGNEYHTDGVSYPACLKSAVAVGATFDNRDQVDNYSNVGTSTLDLLAPGTSITSSVLGNRYATYSGTSMASPHVAGSWALMKQWAPDAQVASVLSHLKSKGTRVYDSRVGASFSRIDIYDALYGFLSESAPPNDMVARAVRLNAHAGSTTGDNVAATREAAEPTYDPQSSHSSWWKWTAPESGYLYANTAASSFDTTMAVYQGNGIGSLNPRQRNDDYGGLQSRIGITVTKGQTYHIAVDGYGTSVGNIKLSWLYRPGNDTFSTPWTLSGAAGVRTGVNSSASQQSGEPNHLGQRSHSVWWKYTAPTAGLLYVNTSGSDFDTVLAAYSGSNVGALTLRASNDDYFGSASRIGVPIQAGQTLRIAVDGYGSERGNIRLAWQFRPGNDLFESAWSLTGRSGSRGSSSTGASIQRGEPSHGGQASHSVWWKWKAPVSGTLYMNTYRSRFDTVLSVYSGSSLGTLTRRAYSDDYYSNRTSRVALRVTKGQTYYIAVDGHGSATGTIGLAWSI